ncbi:MAG: PepSY domain-containing protein [Clostridia bacterium]|nr:PepSY domain-containing protein [Clostridia bacterium]
MKKTLILALTLTISLLLTACGGAMNDLTSDAESLGNSVISGAESAVDQVTDGAESAVKNDEKKSMNLMAGITANDAKDAALRHAGLDESQVSDIDIDLDRDNGTLIYEVDFNSGNTEYDYDINAETGEVISADKSKD